MNYFGHAAVATMHGGNDAFVLGSMLPDLLPMAAIGLPRAFVHQDVSTGVSFHLRTDAVFHETKTFVGLNRTALRDLKGLGISRGPARACAHIGVEMLIDEALAKDERLILSYSNALKAAMLNPQILAPLEPQDLEHAQALCEHLRERGADVFAISPERFEMRLGRALGHRPRLAPRAQELSAIASYLCARHDVAQKLPDLLNEMHTLALGAEPNLLPSSTSCHGPLEPSPGGS